MKSVKKTFIVVGNWKMNPDSILEAKALFSRISRLIKNIDKVEVVVAPPAPFLSDLAGKAGGIITTGAQDVSAEERGSFTGSISAREVQSTGAEYTILGHSERRASGDTDALVANKLKRALEAGLKIVLCVGEKERDEHAHYLRFVREQLVTSLAGLSSKEIKSIRIAYEPVWDIGKSYDKALKPNDIHEMALYIKKVASEILGKKDGLKIPVLYGGSVNFENAQDILKEGGVDGLLIGRQSLDPEAFSNIIHYANNL